MYEENKIKDIVNCLLYDYDDNRYINEIDLDNQPDKKAIIDTDLKILPNIKHKYED